MPENFGQEPQYRTVRHRGFTGMVDGREATQIADTDSPNALNFEFDKDSIATTKGCRKFNNQVAPFAGIRTKASPACPPLSIESGKSVPLRGAGYFPYSSDYDIGGREDYEGTFPTSDTYHIRRGRSFELSVSFRWPEEEKFFEANTKGSGAPTVPDAAFNPPHGFDEALDECCCIIQKGGDRLAMMSWALAVVNVGSMRDGDGTGCTLPVLRPSNYALCWIWYDAPAWGETAPASMMYSLSSGVLPNTGAYSTQAYRAVVLHKFIEPGKDYTVKVRLKVDSGSQGALASNTAWNNDGVFDFYVKEEHRAPERFSFIDSAGGGTANGMEVWKGPTDSIRYFSKYGVRFFGRDAMFAGLGYRFHPWQAGGFVPLGADAAPLENGGFRMIDRSATTVASLYGGTYVLGFWKVNNADAFFRVSHDGFAASNPGNGIDPMAIYSAGYTSWVGQGAGALPFNSEGLRGYRIVATADFTPGTPDSKGAIFSILSYARIGAGDYRVTIQSGATISAFSAGPNGITMLIQSFRWHQRDLYISDLSIWSEPRVYEDPSMLTRSRAKLSIGRTVLIGDQTEPDIDKLLSYWPMDDAGGATLRELVVGGSRSGFLVPMGLGVTSSGSAKQVFLSGEGEALCLDLTDNEILKREIENMLRSDAQGFAIQISCVFTEAFYGIQKAPETLPDGATPGSRARFAPVILSWDTKTSEVSGMKSRPRPLITLTTRQLFHDAASAKYQRPLGFGVEVAHQTDNNNTEPLAPPDLLPWYLNAATVETARFDTSAPWVGKRVTMQIGIQATGTPDQYDVYLAMSPKDAFKPASGDPGEAEFTHWTSGGGSYDASVSGYFTAAHLTIQKKDIFRSIITIGGAWSPKINGTTAALGYSELNARMLVEEVRVFATSGPGTLPSATGGIVAGRDGKLEGSRSLPARVLDEDDLLLPLGRECDSVAVTAGSTTVTPVGSARFFADEPRSTIEAVKSGLLIARGDTEIVPDEETVFAQQASVYRIGSVGADGSTLTLDGAYQGTSRTNTRADLLRVIAYTAFAGSLADRPLTLGSRTVFNPATSTSADIQLTDPIFTNIVPLGVDFRVRVYSPGLSTAELLPEWSRGCVIPRRGKTGEGVIGLTTMGGAVYAAVRGSLFEADDRWRDDGPTDAITKSLFFRSRLNPPATISGVRLPAQGDRAEFLDCSGLILNHGIIDTEVTVIDAWVKADGLSGYQTVLWVGDSASNPENAAGESDLLNRFYQSVRLNRGRPEIVFGSTAYYTGTTQPEKGLFVAGGANHIQEGEWTHIRWYLRTRASGTILMKPYLKVNGKQQTVGVNATDNDASITQTTDWMRVSTLIDNIQSPNWMAILGASRDSYRVPGASAMLSPGGVQLSPQRLHGLMHSLGGQIGEVVCAKQAVWSGTNPTDFNPTAISYTTVLWRTLGAAAEGRGHKLAEQVGGSYGVIRSHPFISLSHEMGLSNDPVSFAVVGQQLYAANGSRPVLVQNGEGMRAGVDPPAVAPNFSLTRYPIWAANQRQIGAESDPIDGAAAGVQPLVYHYRNKGNTYLRQSLAGEAVGVCDWTFVTGTRTNRYFGFKCFLRPDAISGRRVIFRKGLADRVGGPIVEMRNGHLWLGWYDHEKKGLMWLRTSKPVFTPGYVHYVNVRKGFPYRDPLEGNYMNSYWGDGLIRRMTVTALGVSVFVVGETITAGAITGRVTKAHVPIGTTQVLEYYKTSAAEFNTSAITGGTSGATATTPATASIYRPMNDMVVVRRFPKSAPTLYGELDAKPVSFGGGAFSGRPVVSWTTDYGQQPSGTTATGLVTQPGLTFSGSGAPGSVTTAATGAAFLPDMVGMFFQWDTSAGNGSEVYRITGYTSSVAITVSKLDGTAAPAWAAATYRNGGVFSGVSLVRESGFDTSSVVDNSQGEIHMYGCPEALDSTSYVPFAGDIWCPAWVFADGVQCENAQVFETIDTSRATGGAGNDPMYTGFDWMPNTIYDAAAANEIGELHADSTRLYWGADLQTYTPTGGGVSTQPNVTRTVAADTDPTCTLTADADPTWRFVQDPSVWAQVQWCAVAFYDPKQGAISNPGPLLEMRPDEDDTLNPSGAIEIRLTGIPVSRDGGDIKVRLFKSLSSTNADGTLLSAGSSAVQRQIGETMNGTDQFAVRFTEPIYAAQPLLEFDNGAPPACKLLASAQGRLFFGALAAQADGIQYSKAFVPWAVPALNFLRINIGPGDEVTGMADMGGLLIAMMREGVFAISVTATGASQRTVTGSGGCVAPQSVVHDDDRLLWYGDRGLYSYTRVDAAIDMGEATWASEKLKGFFSTGIDRNDAFRSSAAIHRPRNKYVLTVKRIDAALRDGMVSFNGRNFWITRDPNVSAVCSLQPTTGGPPRLVGGTEDGYVAWLDDPDTSLILMGSSEPAVLTAVAAAGSTIEVSGAIDDELDGLRGTKARWRSGGTIREATVLGSDGQYVHLAEPVTAAPAASSAVTVGAQTHLWESKWHDLGNFEKKKRLLYVDLELAPGSTGQIDAYWYVDRNDTTYVKKHTSLSVAGTLARIPVDIQGNWFKLRIESSALTAGSEFAISGINWRLGETDQD